MTVKASNDLELTQIWVPDFDLLNRIEGVQSWAEVMAEVRYDGKVTWERNGVIDIACTFTGISMMPFDTIGFQMLFGGTAQKHLYKYNANPGIVFNTRTPSFRKFTIDANKVSSILSILIYTHILSNIKCIYSSPIPLFSYFTPELFGGQTEVLYVKPVYFQGELIDNPQGVIYNFYFKRSSDFYIWKILIPTILFTYVSFGIFLLDLRSKERVGFAMSILLVNVAQYIIAIEYIPISQDTLWLVNFIRCSTYWSFAALFETIFVSWLLFKAGTHIDDENDKNFGNEESLTCFIKKDRISETSEEEEKEEEMFTATCENEEELASIEDSSCVAPCYIATTEEILPKKVKIARLPSLLLKTSENLIRPLFHMTEKQRIERINKIDLFSIFLVPISYSIFVFIMLIDNSTFEDNVVWVQGVNISSEL